MQASEVEDLETLDAFAAEKFEEHGFSDTQRIIAQALVGLAYATGCRKNYVSSSTNTKRRWRKWN